MKAYIHTHIYMQSVGASHTQQTFLRLTWPARMQLLMRVVSKLAAALESPAPATSAGPTKTSAANSGATPCNQAPIGGAQNRAAPGGAVMPCCPDKALGGAESKAGGLGSAHNPLPHPRVPHVSGSPGGGHASSVNDFLFQHDLDNVNLFRL